MENLKVCDRCLMAIESREGKQLTVPRYRDEEESEDFACEWCGEDMYDELHEFV